MLMISFFSSSAPSSICHARGARTRHVSCAYIHTTLQFSVFHPSRSTVTEVPCFDCASVQAACEDDLRILRNEVNRLVTPLHVVAVHVEYDALYGLLAFQLHPSIDRCNLQPGLCDGREVDVLERFRPNNNER